MKIIYHRQYALSTLNSLHAGKIFMIICRLLNFFKINFFEKFFQEYHQSVNQFESIVSGLIWVQTVCKGYQQMTLAGKEFITNETRRQFGHEQLTLSLVIMLVKLGFIIKNILMHLPL